MSPTAHPHVKRYHFVESLQWKCFRLKIQVEPTSTSDYQPCHRFITSGYKMAEPKKLAFQFPFDLIDEG